jgi:hypothetical protein
MVEKDSRRRQVDSCLYLSECADPELAQRLVALAHRFMTEDDERRRAVRSRPLVRSGRD